MSNKWELAEDGYHRRQRLVNYPAGLVVGHTSGSNHNNDGWYAATDGPDGLKRLGEFVTEDLAKKAVENAQPSLPSKKDVSA